MNSVSISFSIGASSPTHTLIKLMCFSMLTTSTASKRVEYPLFCGGCLRCICLKSHTDCSRGLPAIQRTPLSHFVARTHRLTVVLRRRIRSYILSSVSISGPQFPRGLSNLDLIRLKSASSNASNSLRFQAITG